MKKITKVAKVAKLVEFSLTTRVIVDENATDEQIVNSCYKKIENKINNRELNDNLNKISGDKECPFGTFESDIPSIDTVILSVIDKQYFVIGNGVPFQIIPFDNYSDWDSVLGDDGDSLFDVQIDFDDSFKMDDEKEYYQFQYVDLILDEDNNWSAGNNYQNVDNFIITDKPLAQAVGEYFEKI